MLDIKPVYFYTDLQYLYFIYYYYFIYLYFIIFFYLFLIILRNHLTINLKLSQKFKIE